MHICQITVNCKFDCTLLPSTCPSAASNTVDLEYLHSHFDTIKLRAQCNFPLLHALEKMGLNLNTVGRIETRDKVQITW